MMVINIIVTLLVVVAWYRNCLQGQVQILTQKKILTVAGIYLPVKTDGKPNESTWHASPASDSFIEIETAQAAKSKFPASVISHVKWKSVFSICNPTFYVWDDARVKIPDDDVNLYRSGRYIQLTTRHNPSI